MESSKPELNLIKDQSFADFSQSNENNHQSNFMNDPFDSISFPQKDSQKTFNLSTDQNVDSKPKNIASISSSESGIRQAPVSSSGGSKKIFTSDVMRDKILPSLVSFIHIKKEYTTK